MAGGVSVGDLLDGKYRVTRMIGEGGWGIVFEAENVRTLKRIALKVLRNQANVTADIRTRFEREAQAAGRIGSEHIVEVFDLGTTEDGSLYMVMELLAGEDLGTRLRAGRLDPVTAGKLVAQLLDGLGAAHEAGILHRDLKPENLFLVPTRGGGDEFVKILDFGISKFSGAQLPSSNTVTGAVLGSPCYMAPEQARGLKQIDARTDIYAVGTVLFECVTGRVPFQGDNFNDLMFRIVLAPRPDPRELEPSVDPVLAGIILKAISTDPCDRYASAEEMKTALAEWLAGQGVVSVRAPDVRRTVRTPNRTPPTAPTPPATPAATTPGRKERPHWSDATIPVESGADTGTPIASTRSVGLPTVDKRRRAVAAMLAAAFTVLVLVGGVALLRGRHTTSAASPGTAEPAPPPLPAPPAAPADLAPAPTAVPAMAAVEPDGEPAAPPATTAAVAAPTSSHHGRVHAGAKDAGPVAEPAKPPASASPAVPPAASAKPTDKVEGREIRTNL